MNKKGYKGLRCKHCNKLLLTYKDNINITVKCNRCKNYIDLKIVDDKINYNNNAKIK
jgi:phage FluMu protein Com